MLEMETIEETESEKLSNLSNNNNNAFSITFSTS